MVDRNLVKWLAFWGAIGAVGAGLSACMALVDTSDLTGGAAEPLSTPEAGQPGDAPPSTSPKDAGATDGATVVEIPGAPCDDIAPGARTFCKQREYDWGYKYCRDFDDDLPIAFGWESTTVGPEGSIGRDECHRASAPAALRSRIEAHAASCSSAAVAQKVQVGSSFQIQFSLRIRHASPDASWFTIRLGGAGCDLVFSGDGSFATVREESGSEPVDHPLHLRFPLPDAWTRVWVNVDRAARTLDVQLDRKSTMSTPAKLGPACQTTGEITIELGLQCASPGETPNAVLFDSVVVP